MGLLSSLSGILSGGTGMASSGSGPTDVDPAYMIMIQSYGDGPNGIARTIRAYMPESFQGGVQADYDTPFADSLSWLPETIKLGMRMRGIPTTTQIMSMQVWQGSSPMDFSLPLVFLMNTNADTDVIQPVRDLLTLVLPTSLDGGHGLMTSPGPKLAPKIGQEGDIGTRIADSVVAGAQGAGAVAGAALGSLPDLVGAAAGLEVGLPSRERLADNINAGVDAGADLMKSLGGLLDSARIVDNISLRIGNFLFFESVVVRDVNFDMEIKLDKYQKKPIGLQVTVSFTTFMNPKTQDIARILP